MSVGVACKKEKYSIMEQRIYVAVKDTGIKIMTAYGGTTPKPKFSMFSTLSQNYHNLFEK